MKKKIFIAVLGIIFISCTSNEKKAEKLITQTLKETLHDWSSYESVKFGTLDSTFTTVYNDTVYLSYKAKLMAYFNKLEETMKEIKFYDDMYSNWALQKRKKLLMIAQMCLDTIKIYEPIYKEMEENFTPEFKGWKMQHSFRAKNAGGNKVIRHYLYYFDKDLTKVNYSEDIGENSNKKNRR